MRESLQRAGCCSGRNSRNEVFAPTRPCRNWGKALNQKLISKQVELSSKVIESKAVACIDPNASQDRLSSAQLHKQVSLRSRSRDFNFFSFVIFSALVKSVLSRTCSFSDTSGLD